MLQWVWMSTHVFSTWGGASAMAPNLGNSSELGIEDEIWPSNCFVEGVFAVYFLFLFLLRQWRLIMRWGDGRWRSLMWEDWEDLPLVLSFDSFCIEGAENLKSRLWVCKSILLRSTELIEESAAKLLRNDGCGFQGEGISLHSCGCHTHRPAMFVNVPESFGSAQFWPPKSSTQGRFRTGENFSFFLSYFILMPPHVIVVWFGSTLQSCEQVF